MTEADKELKLIFPKKSKISSPNQKIFEQYNEIFRQQEELQRKTNIQMLMREIANDTLQLPIKTLAYYNAPMSLKSTFYAELVRSFIDATNHVILLITNFVPVGPSLKYPYGIEKLKNAVVLIPAALFMYMGGELLIDQIQSLFYNGAQVAHGQHHENNYSLILYLVSMGIEMGVIYKNMMDAKNIENNETENDSIFGFLKQIFYKKDPVLQVILFENMITFLSTSIPLLCMTINHFYSSPFVEIIGSSIIGVIQLYLGFHLGSKNLEHVVGEKGIETQIMDDVVKIIKENEYILDVKDEKAVMIGSKKFRFYANIEFDIPKLNETIKEEYNQIIERVIYQPHYTDRREELNDLIISVPSKVLRQIQQSINEIEKNIMTKYPSCSHVDLEIDHNKLFTVFDEYDSFRSFLHDDEEHQEYTMNNSAISKQFSKWVLKESDRILSQNIDYKALGEEQQTKPQQKNILTYKQYKQTFQHYSNQISLDFIEEYEILNQNQREIIIQDDVNLIEQNFEIQEEMDEQSLSQEKIV